MVKWFKAVGQSFVLLLPALMPSWRFFESIAPSPRIEYCLTNQDDSKNEAWVRFDPRPEHVGFLQGLRRLAYNPAWADYLYASSCAERLIINPTMHSEHMIIRRLKSAVSVETIEQNYLQFRLVFISHEDNEIKETILYYSQKHALHKGVE